MDTLVERLKRQIAVMRKIADDTEEDIPHNVSDKEQLAFYDGRVCCLREQALNIEDIIKEHEQESKT